MITSKDGKVYTKEFLVSLRNTIETTIHNVDDETALTAITLFPTWEKLLAEGKEFTSEDVEKGFRLQYNDVLYKVLQPHIMQENWTPDTAASLYAEVLILDENVIYEWKQPESTNGYSVDAEVAHNGKIWVSLVDNNIWEPGAVGTENVWKEKEVISE